MLLLTALLVLAIAPHLASCSFLIGRGVADATGVIAEGILYGYADPSQDARGLHLRQFSRTFIVANKTGTSRIAIVVVEASMVSQAVTTGVLEELAERYGDLYTARNLLLSPTHSHSCPGGFHTYALYAAPSLGAVPQSYDTFVSGIVRSLVRAHENLQEGEIELNEGLLTDAGINRSPAAYDNNPATERDRYETNVDPTMTLLKFKDMSGELLGAISFFAVHPTSMKKTNHLLSSDNKGYAAQRMERYLNPGQHPGQVSIPVAFAQTTNGDVSPNTEGSFCETTNEPCDYLTSTCSEDLKDPKLCNSRGPTGNQLEDTRINGEKQFLKAKELLDAGGELLSGEVDYIHQHVNLSGVIVPGTDGQNVSLCRPAMGFSFAAGATDGPGLRPFTQGDTEGNETIEAAVKWLLPYPDNFVACHHPKPILLPSGYAPESWPFQPEVVPLQIMRIGDLVLIGMPGEVTTMAGRRVGEAIKQAMVAEGAAETLRPLVLSMTNSYTSYITTPEEYQVQRYEGASTIFGPNTLPGYIQELSKMAAALVKREGVDPGPEPRDLRGKPPVLIGYRVKTDLKGWSESWGTVLSDVDLAYQQGSSVSATFRSGNPRNDLKTEGTYLAVERQMTNGSWEGHLTDAYWETRLDWSSSCHDVGLLPPVRCLLSQTSNVTVTWDVPSNQEPGIYRLLHYGNAKTLAGVRSYTGISSAFEVIR